MKRTNQALGLVGVFMLLFTAPVQAQTKVKTNGRDITITVPIDGIGIDKKTAAEWKRNAESLWNAAFGAADNPFKNCLTLKLVVDVKARDYNYPAQRNRHMIFGSYGSGPSQARGTVAYHGNPYKTAADGNFDESFGDSSKANYVAHEVGHLLGLRDDYKVTGTNPRKTTPLDGRQNTLMADGGRIDPTLLKRLVDLLRKETHQIPDCPRGWKGSFGVSVHQPLSSGMQDFYSNMDLTLTGDGKGGLTGEISGTESQTLDLVKCQSTTVTPGTVKAKLSGALSGDRITLLVTDRQSTPPTLTPCSRAIGQPGFMGPVFEFPHFDEPFRELTPTGDGTHQYDREFSIPLGPDVYTVRYTLKVRIADR